MFRTLSFHSSHAVIPLRQFCQPTTTSNKIAAQQSSPKTNGRSILTWTSDRMFILFLVSNRWWICRQLYRSKHRNSLAGFELCTWSIPSMCREVLVTFRYIYQLLDSNKIFYVNTTYAEYITLAIPFLKICFIPTTLFLTCGTSGSNVQ